MPIEVPAAFFHTGLVSDSCQHHQERRLCGRVLHLQHPRDGLCHREQLQVPDRLPTRRWGAQPHPVDLGERAITKGRGRGGLGCPAHAFHGVFVLLEFLPLAFPIVWMELSDRFV